MWVQLYSLIQGIHFLDILVLCVLLLGWRGGQNKGGNVMLPRFLKWLTALVLASLIHPWVASIVLIFNVSEGLALVGSYVGILIMVWLGFVFVEEKLQILIKDSGVFGEMEDSGGALLGIMTHAILILIFMCLLHGDRTTDARAAKITEENRESFGEISIPTIWQWKRTVFNESGFGQLVETKLGSLLISDEEMSVQARTLDLF